MRAWLGLALAVMLGCSHDTRPAVQPDEPPPLPPASGTPIGYLVDDATELKLRDDQLTQLKTIDTELSARLDVLDTELHGSTPSPAASTPAAGRHRGGHRGGGRRGAMGRNSTGGNSTGGSSTGASNTGSTAGSASTKPNSSGRSNADAINRATEERAADVRAALERAFALFDPAQQQIAKRVLADHGVDLDAGRSQASPAEGEPGEDEPDTGSGGN